MNDEELRQNIIDELGFEPSIEATNVGVAVKTRCMVSPRRKLGKK